MKKKILLPFFLVASLMSFAQKQTMFYAITPADEGTQWLNIKLINAANGKVVKTIFDYSNPNVSFLNAVTNTPVAGRSEGNGPTGSMVAAMAFSGSQKKIFFIPMRIGELRWADISKSVPEFFTLEAAVLSKLNYSDDANHFTRMVIGADDYGYALTNDGNHLIKFATGKKTTVTDLGNLVDASSNGAISIHNRCTSFGGDMVASADGSIYLISHQNHVFQFNPADRIANYLGHIEGLPQNFTSNGAAVTDEGDVLVSCGYGNQLYYKINLQTLTAEPAFTTVSKNTNASDLASGNLVFRAKNNNNSFIDNSVSTFTAANQKIALFPNPVTENRFQINFEQTKKGVHTIQLLDLSGKVLLNKIVSISGGGQYVGVDVNPAYSKGVYMVKVMNAEKETVFSGKVVLQ